MRHKIFIRVDGGPQIGLGHIVRCMALANMLNDRFIITFICMEIPNEMIKKLFSNGYLCRIIENESDFFDLLSNNCIVVLDGYHFDVNYQNKIKASGAKLVCIDDLHNKDFVADLIINHTPGITPQDYRALPFTQYALGIEYALLLPPFLKQAEKLRTIEKIEKVIICFGGSDYKNLTQSTLQAVIGFSQFKIINVITGLSYYPTCGFKQLVASDTRINHFHAINEEDMLETMLESDLAIVPSSGILFEVLAAGCVAISGYYIDNQKLVYENFKNLNYIGDAANFSIEQTNCAINQALSSHIHHTKIFDGKSSIRISKLFYQIQNESKFRIRKATIMDIDLTFSWANDVEIRRFSFNQHQISKLEHTNWFLKKLTDKKCYYSILEYNFIPIGSIRFDIIDGEAKISYLLESTYHGLDFGIILLKKGIERLLSIKKSGQRSIKKISGEVMKTNFSSIKIFVKMGFNQKEENEIFFFEKIIL